MSSQSIPENLPEVADEPPRESLILTAVKFLQNPKVLDSSIEKKKTFLSGKGLTSQEIEIAISRAGVLSSSLQNNSTGIIIKPNEQVTLWSRFRDYSAVAIVFGTIVYGVYYVFKKFIQPLFLKTAKEQEQRLDCLEVSINNISTGLSRDMQEIQNALTEIRQHLEDNSSKLDNFSNESSNQMSNYNREVTNTAVGEMKAEITSIKALLLSRRQFPATPNNPPVIPSWQLKPVEVKSDDSKSKEVPVPPLKNGESIEENELKENHSENNGLDIAGIKNGLPVDLKINGTAYHSFKESNVISSNNVDTGAISAQTEAV